MPTDLSRCSATELLALYRTKACSPVEATQAVLARISSLNARLNAFRLVDPERALAAARESEERWRRGEPRGLVDGVPTSVKDVLLTIGWSTRLGSTLTSEAGPWEVDAPPVARMREHGAILLGKTNTSEFHWKTVTDSPLTGITRNPWNPELTPGGSCGGATAAVAAGMGPLALGTDGGGSIRVPCAFTGVFGLKPTFGRVPQYPAGAFGTMAHVGPIARSAADAALALTVIARPDDRDWYALPFENRDYRDGLEFGVRGLTIAFSPDLGLGGVDPEVARVVADAASAFSDLGARVVEVDEVSTHLAVARETFETLGFPGIALSTARFTNEERSRMDPGLVAVAKLGERIGIMEYMAANRAREQLGLAMNTFHRSYDLLLTPTVPILPFPVGRDVPDSASQERWTEWAPFSYPFNMTRQPAASLPCGFAGNGMPVGLQVVGPLNGDAQVLRACHAFERARPIVYPERIDRVPSAGSAIGSQTVEPPDEGAPVLRP